MQNLSNFSSSLPIENEIDIYTQEKFEVLKNERLKNKTDFYVSEIEEGGRKFYFEGAKFVENFIRTVEAQHFFVNPLTRGKIERLNVYKFDISSQKYIKKFDAESIKHQVNYLPVILSDTTKCAKEQGVYFFMLAECYREGKNCNVDKNLMISYFRKSAQLGNEDAQFNFSVLLGEMGYVRESIYWAVKPWENIQIENIPVEGLIDIANCFERVNLCKEAFSFYVEAACLGNPHAIAKVIRYYDQGFGIKKNTKMIEFWSQYIPQHYRNKNSLEYLKSTCFPEYKSMTQEIYMPEEMQYIRLKNLPDPSQFPETDSIIFNTYLKICKIFSFSKNLLQ